MRFLPLLLAAMAACSSIEPARNEMAPAREAQAPRAAAAEPVPAPSAALRQGPHGIAARVNNEIVTWKDVADAVAKVRGPVSPDLRKSTLRQIAEERLFLQAAKKNGVTVGEQEVDDAIRRDIKTYGGEEEYEKWLRIKTTTKTEAREEKRKTLLIYKLYRHIIQKSFSQPDATTPGLLVDSVAPIEIAEYFAQHKDQFKAIENVSFGRIALQFANPREKEAKRALMESIVRRLGEGSDFAMLSLHYSDIRRARDFDDRHKTRKELQDVPYGAKTIEMLFDTLKPGEISGIVEDANSLNLFRLEQRIQQREETAEEAEPKIRSTIESRKREENRRKLKEHLVKDAYLWPADLFDEE